MATYVLNFANNQLGNFNSAGLTSVFGSQNLKINSAHPGDRLVSSGAIGSVNQITGWRLTVQGDMEPGDNDVVPGAPMIIEYSTDNGATWQSYSVGIGQPDAVWYARQDEEGWMAITANVPGQPDGQMGFIVADAGVSPGQIFTTDETVLETQIGEYALPCFTAGTLITTPTGPQPIETLRPGDLVMTLDGGAQPLRWIGHRRVSRAEMQLNPKLRPIRFAVGSLGEGLPRRELLVSRQHRMFLRRDAARDMLGSDEILVAAHHLTGLPGVEQVMPETAVTYVHLLFDRHQLVWAEESLSESLFTGAEALKALGQAASEEIAMLFPELLQKKPRPARPFPQRGKQARSLVQPDLAA